ncbi:hypothetical protein TrST_g2302 [Triparma strigata]|uniref:Clu domain-containing protein n=1 Tax=Triparma strigata TaxID=1606541 RepID=A0A9W7E8R0_9STRA|nr:hypothetical protein TrST_g2302 [Triparma strigata]
MSDDAVVTPSSPSDVSVSAEEVPPVSTIDLRILSPTGADIVLKSTPLSEGAANVLSGVLPLVQGFAEYTNVELVSETGAVLSPYSLLSEYDLSPIPTLTLRPVPYTVTASKNHVNRLLSLLKSPPTFSDVGKEGAKEPPSPQPPSTPSVKNLNPDVSSVPSSTSFLSNPLGVCFSALPPPPTVPSLRPLLNLLGKTSITMRSNQVLSQKDALRGVLSLWQVKTHGSVIGVESTAKGYRLDAGSENNKSKKSAGKPREIYDTLLALLLSESAKFSKTWTEVLTLLKTPPRAANYLQTLSSIYTSPSFIFGSSRTLTEDLPLLCQGRTWSRDISEVRKMDTSTPLLSHTKLQTQLKIRTDFTYACLAILKSIVSGFLQPLNPGSPPEECVYVSNDILVSHPSTPSSYSVHGSSEATSKLLKKEVTYQPLLAPLNTTNMMIEYLGVKYCFIVLVPGVMSGSDFLRVGCLENTYESKEVDGICKEIFTSLGMKPSSILKDVKGENTDDKVEIVMPVEAKAVRGDNGEYYILECGRLTGLDNLWLHDLKDYSSPTKSNKDKNYVVGAFPELDTMRVYRYELDGLYGDYQRQLIREKVYEKVRNRITELDETIKKEIREEIAKVEPTKEDEKTPEEIDEVFNEVSTRVAKKYEGKREEYVKEAEAEQKALLETVKVETNVNVGYGLKGIEDDKFDNGKSDFLKYQLLKVAVQVLNASTYPGSGEELVEYFHEQGLNLRYMGYVADRSYEEHQKEQQIVRNKRIPVSWLQLLEIEMVCRAAKRVLNRLYGEVVDKLDIVAEVFNAVMCEREETVAEVEKRGGDGGDETKGYGEIWEDIKAEVGKRFRYNLKFLPDNSLSLPLLTRMCELNGVKIESRTYPFTTTNQKFAYSCNYPLTSSDIVSIDCLVRGGAKSPNIGFDWNGEENPNAAVSVPSADRHLNLAVNTYMQGSKGDPRVALESANIAAELYADVCGIGHRKVTECVDLISKILLKCGEVAECRRNQLKVLAGHVGQGVTSYKVRDAHKFAGEAAHMDGDYEIAVGHFETAAAIYEVNAGPNHPEIFQIWHIIATIYEKSSAKKPAHLALAKKWAEKAMNAESVPGLSEQLDYKKTMARLLSASGEHEKAIDLSKKITDELSRFYPAEHGLVKASVEDVKKFSRLKIENDLAVATGAVDLDGGAGGGEGGGEEGKKKKKKKKKTKKK